jgi:hypothetical protein
MRSMRFKVNQQSSSSKGICAHKKEGRNIHIYFKQVRNILNQLSHDLRLSFHPRFKPNKLHTS